MSTVSPSFLFSFLDSDYFDSLYFCNNLRWFVNFVMVPYFFIQPVLLSFIVARPS